MAEEPVDFKVVGQLRQIEAIAKGRGVDIRKYLQSKYGGRTWRKMKAVASIEHDDGYIGEAEIHWFEAHGVGRVHWKIKRKLEV